jgi:prepilin-type N-terminal cleavage/methylation domain-containing protein
MFKKGVGKSMNVPNKTKGFTIIEVVLVLAIAGLIFLVVFLALPALQRGQRDSQRKQDLGKLMSQVTAYQSNTQGTLPNGIWNSTFKDNYLTVNSTPFADPSNGSTYTLTQQTATTGAGAPSGITAGLIWVYPGVTCTNVNAGSGTISTTSRTFAAIIYQEQGVYTCQNN